MYEHKCKHERFLFLLKFCEICDVVYCEKCGREWGNTTWACYPNYQVTYDSSTTTCGPMGIMSNTTCSHGKKK